MASGPDLDLRLTGFAFAGAAPLFGVLELQVAGGEVVALLGASGVGKTTLLRMIAGLQGGYGGKILVGGVPAAEAPAPGLVFQDARLLPWLTVADNLRAVSAGITAERIAVLLRQVGLGGTEALWPRQLSGGMQRRLALARALSVNAGLLLLDEPFVSLDRGTLREMQALLRQVLGLYRPTVVLVTHDPEDAAALADRVVVLEGRPARIATGD